MQKRSRSGVLVMGHHNANTPAASTLTCPRLSFGLCSHPAELVPTIRGAEAKVLHKQVSLARRARLATVLGSSRLISFLVDDVQPQDRLLSLGQAAGGFATGNGSIRKHSAGVFGPDSEAMHKTFFENAPKALVLQLWPEA